MSLQTFTSALSDVNSLNSQLKHAAFQNFITYYNSLVVAVLNTKTFSDKQLSQHIFKYSWSNKLDVLVFEKHLFAAKNTLDRLSNIVNANNFTDYQFAIDMLTYDLYDIIAYVETKYLNNQMNYEMRSRPDQSPREVFDISRMLFHITALNTTNLYAREFIPVSTFLIRQMIEIYGRKLIGFYSITYEDGTRVKSVSTQVARNFIKEEMGKTNPRISLPVDIDMIRKIETWTNHYVHTGHIPPIYLIENVIHLVEPLIYPANTTVADYKGSVKFSGTSTITNYVSIKDDFTKYLNQEKERGYWATLWYKLMLLLKKRNPKKTIVVNWLPESQIESTILSL